MALSTITSFSDGFNLGQQLSLALFDTSGVSYDLGRITKFTSTPMVTEIDSKTIVLNGYVDYKDSRQGWTFEVTSDRTTGVEDYLEAAQERAFHAGQPQQYFTLQAQILNDDGTVNEFSFQRCVVHLSNAGAWSLDEKVEIQLTGRAAERVVLQ